MNKGRPKGATQGTSTQPYSSGFRASEFTTLFSFIDSHDLTAAAAINSSSSPDFKMMK
jgi:hypothetical protein